MRDCISDNGLKRMASKLRKSGQGPDFLTDMGRTVQNLAGFEQGYDEWLQEVTTQFQAAGVQVGDHGADLTYLRESNYTPDEAVQEILGRQNAQVSNPGQEIEDDDVSILAWQMMAELESIVTEHLSPYLGEGSTERYKGAMNVLEKALLKLPDEFVKRLWVWPWG